MLCSEIMTTDVEYISAQTTLREAACRMRDLNIGFLPICDEFERPIGTLTDRDIAVRAVAYGVPPTTTVQHLMARELVSCSSSDDVERARELMEAYSKSRIICTGTDGRLVGVISLADLTQVDDQTAAAALSRVSERSNDATGGTGASGEGSSE